MISKTFDFAVLGDGQPEGLLAAAGLVRKGYSVTVIPSSVLGELPPEDNWPMSFPTQLGEYKLDDLLFRAGFFQLEESGLSAKPFLSQVILPKNRLMFDGTKEQWLNEVEREFPAYSKTLFSIWQSVQGSKALTNQSGIKKATSDLVNLQKKNPAIKRWISAEVESSLHPTVERTPEMLAKAWLNIMRTRGSKTYRTSTKLKKPYTSFLLEHARKWGVYIWDESFVYKPSWGAFNLGKNAKAKYLILNGIGGGRAIARKYTKNSIEKMQYWLYTDQTDCPIECLPEPLQEYCHIDLERDGSQQTSVRVLYTNRDALRGEANLSMGTWLSFENTKSWVSEIEKSRALLKKVIPYLPDECFKPLPSLLDLTEMRGECVKRGQVERLIPYKEEKGYFQKMLHKFINRIKFWRTPFSITRNVYAVTPHYLPFRTRSASLHEALYLVNFFTKKRKKS